MATLQAVQSQRGGDGDDGLKFLSHVLASKELQALLRVHSKISTIVGKSPLSHGEDVTNGETGCSEDVLIPTVSNSYSISCEVIDVLSSYIQRSGSRDARDLVHLLQRPPILVHQTNYSVYLG